jgi:hypothetical protein
MNYIKKNIFQLHSEIALSRKPFGIGHRYIYTFLLRMTAIVTSQNVDVYSWDNLHRVFVMERVKDAINSELNRAV